MSPATAQLAGLIVCVILFAAIEDGDGSIGRFGMNLCLSAGAGFFTARLLMAAGRMLA